MRIQTLVKSILLPARTGRRDRLCERRGDLRLRVLPDPGRLHGMDCRPEVGGWNGRPGRLYAARREFSSLDEVMAEVDRLMYEAKGRGRSLA
jgi:hypothetical protein